MEEVLDFIDGLKKARHIYAECPFCQSIFSLHTARLIYGKQPPKDFLSKAQRQVRETSQKMQNMDKVFETSKEEWQRRFEETNQSWQNKLTLKDMLWKNQERTLKEKVRHITTDVAAAQKEVIEEKVDKALLRQRGVIEGHIAELFPLFKKTRINPADLCALIPTSPLDFIAFEGLFQKEVRNIIFLDVKKGKAQLNPVQKSIRDAIKDGNIEFKKLRVNFEKVKGTVEEEQ